MKSIRHIESSLRNAEASHKFAKLLKCVSFQPVISTETASKDNNARVLTTLLYTCEDDIQETFEAAGNILFTGNLLGLFLVYTGRCIRMGLLSCKVNDRELKLKWTVKFSKNESLENSSQASL